MAVTYKDIDQLTQKASPTGAEKLPVSDTEYITPQQIAGMVEVDSTPSVHSENPVQNKVATETFIRAGRLTYLSINDGYMKIDGTTAVVSNHSYAKYEVTPGKTYMFSVGFYTGYSTGQMRAVIWLDSSDNVLSYSDEGCNKNEARHYLDVPIKAPANAAYAVLNSRTTYVVYPTLKALSWSIPEKTSELTNDSGYLKYVLLADEAAYEALATKDPGTLYLIPEV